MSINAFGSERSPSKAFRSPHKALLPPAKRPKTGRVARALILRVEENEASPPLGILYKIPLFALHFHEQIFQFDEYAKKHLADLLLSEARAYASEILNGPFDEEAKWAELALLRYFVERDSHFVKPKVSLIQDKIDELLATFEELEAQKHPRLPTGILHTLHVVLARILVLPSGSCNLIAGSHAMKKIAAHPKIVAKIGLEYHVRLMELIKDLQERKQLRDCLEKSNEIPIHKNMQPLVRESLCIGPKVALYPHYSTWLILIALMGKTRQYTSPDCAIHSLHRIAVSDKAEKVAERMCRWFETGMFTIRKRTIPIDYTLVIPPLTLELSTDQVELDSPVHPVLDHVASVASRHLTGRRGSKVLSAHLMRSFGVEVEQRFERALAGQFENLLIHLHLCYMRLVGNNDRSDHALPATSNTFGQFFSHILDIYLGGFSGADQLKSSWLCRLEERLWLYDTKYEVLRTQDNILMFDTRHGESFGLRTSKKNEAFFIDWLRDSRFFYDLEGESWQPLNSYETLKAAILREFKGAVETVYATLPVSQQRAFRLKTNQVEKHFVDSFEDEVATYISMKTRLKPAQCRKISPQFKQLGYNLSVLTEICYGNMTKWTCEPKSPREMVRLIAKAVHHRFIGQRAVAVGIKAHATICPIGIFQVPAHADQWIEEKMIQRGLTLLTKPIHQELICQAEKKLPTLNILNWAKTHKDHHLPNAEGLHSFKRQFRPRTGSHHRYIPPYSD